MYSSIVPLLLISLASPYLVIEADSDSHVDKSPSDIEQCIRRFVGYACKNHACFRKYPEPSSSVSEVGPPCAVSCNLCFASETRSLFTKKYSSAKLQQQTVARLGNMCADVYQRSRSYVEAEFLAQTIKQFVDEMKNLTGVDLLNDSKALNVLNKSLVSMLKHGNRDDNMYELLMLVIKMAFGILFLTVFSNTSKNFFSDNICCYHQTVKMWIETLLKREVNAN